jgi:8-oxo-dGTP pyrophosphatase MutT (NUDIX family)
MDAAVLVPLFRDLTGELHLVMIRRTGGRVHGGQLAFPGGRPESEDGSMLETAIRETQEKIGLRRDRIQILEELPRVETMTTGYRIYPFLSHIDHPGEWRKEPTEVDEVLELEIDTLSDPECLQLGLEQAPNWTEPRRIAFFLVGPERLWGASFRIVRPLLPRLLSNEWAIP